MNVPTPDDYIKPTGTKNITENGTHDVSEYASAEVNVESEAPVLQTLEVNITEPGIFEFAPESGYDGIVKIIVGVDAPQLTAPTVSLNGSTLTITATDTNTEAFAILVDGIEMVTVEKEEV